MMLGLERIERMRLFAAELTAPTSPTPRASRLTGGRASARRTGEPAAAEPSQETGLQGRSRQPTQACTTAVTLQERHCILESGMWVDLLPFQHFGHDLDAGKIMMSFCSTKLRKPVHLQINNGLIGL